MAKNYVKIYLDFFGLYRGDYIGCTTCTKPSDDIHHIVKRSHGGLNEIENLIALCRQCHNALHGIGKGLHGKTQMTVVAALNAQKLKILMYEQNGKK